MQPLLSYDVSLEVRDYECDAQGVVNNAVYFHYFEHARNMLFWNRNLSLTTLHEMGEDPVVARAEIEYRYPLQARDRIEVRTSISQRGSLRLIFSQTLQVQEREGNSEHAKLDAGSAMMLEARAEARSRHGAGHPSSAYGGDDAAQSDALRRTSAAAQFVVVVLCKGRPVPLADTQLWIILQDGPPSAEMQHERR